jgi:hypothetical protein
MLSTLMYPSHSVKTRQIVMRQAGEILLQIIMHLNEIDFQIELEPSTMRKLLEEQNLLIKRKSPRKKSFLIS